eukprot:CAMPEP_0171234500 /NCGR_PEP_ID=MMETSP0790-20130122/41463_1 /TAXON_ID=2925 /ORGANISM="Alexandrium catenella, Strain OF101" /LENGTH=201 /DNA_ID=CAMNT_0011700783 /DNA_START=283 /DNA_END=885 /DNA_ORIENTATION=+
MNRSRARKPWMPVSVVVVPKQPQEVEEKIDDVQVQVECREDVVVDAEGDLVALPLADDELRVVDNVEGEEDDAKSGIALRGEAHGHAEERQQGQREAKGEQRDEEPHQIRPEACEVGLRSPSVDRHADEDHGGNGRGSADNALRVGRRDHADKDGLESREGEKHNVVCGERLGHLLAASHRADRHDGDDQRDLHEPHVMLQ